jgi:hypothetical protein
MIEELCNQLLKELEIARSPLLSYLQAGIPKETVDDVLGKNNVELDIPEEVYSLYQWRNGLDEGKVKSKAMGEIELFRLAVFSSLNISVQSYQGSDLQNYSPSKSLFPLFESSGGEFYLIDTDKKSDTYKMIIYFSFSNPYVLNGASIFDSLDACLTTVVECYRIRAYYYVPGLPDLEINPKLEMPIWEHFNPRSEYYKIMKNS